MGKKGDIGDGPSPNAEELDKKPEPQDEQGRKTDQLNKDKNKKQGENARARKKNQISTQNPGHRSAGPNHRNGRFGIGKNLSQAGNQTTDQVEKKEAEMPQRILDVIPEDPQVKHVSEDVEKPTMKKHGRKNGEGKGNFRELPEDPSMVDLIRNCPPFENEILAFDGIQGHLVVENQTIDQDQPEGNEGKS